MCKDECQLAAYIKKGFDSEFHPTWQAVVGRTFGAMPLALLPLAASPLELGFR